jgi:CheY-like chemotaxis protein
MTADRRREDQPAVATILVVDDSTAIRRLIGRSLLEAGYRVVEASSGPDARPRVDHRRQP